jgi:hypothetical protein
LVRVAIGVAHCALLLVAIGVAHCSLLLGFEEEPPLDDARLPHVSVEVQAKHAFDLNGMPLTMHPATLMASQVRMPLAGLTLTMHPVTLMTSQVRCL